MARKSKRKTRRRRQSGISIVGLAETYMLTSVATKTLFNVDAIEFVMGNPSNPKGLWGVTAGQNKIGIRELFSLKQGQHVSGMKGNYNLQAGSTKATTAVIADNLRENAATGIAGMILIPLGFKLGKKLARPAITRANKLLKDVGVGNTVRV